MKSPHQLLAAGPGGGNPLRTLVFRKITNLRRFASGNFVFDDLVAEVHVVGNEMPNMPFPVGTTMNVRLVHCFELRDGQITREIAYEM
jgi:hypothetical protein